MRRHMLIVAAAWMLVAAAPSFATIVMTTQTSGLTENSCSNSDLLQTAFGSFIGGIELDGRPTQREPYMRNGIAEATIGGGDYRYVAGAGQYVEWALNLGVGNGGFDITRIDTYEVWTLGRCGQNYSVLVSFVGAPTTYFTLISAAASPGGFVIGSSGVLDLVSFTDNSGGVLDNGTIQATGVARIRFNFANADTYGANMYREFDLFGSATIPEPATLTLLALGGLGLWHRRRPVRSSVPGTHKRLDGNDLDENSGHFEAKVLRERESKGPGPLVRRKWRMVRHLRSTLAFSLASKLRLHGMDVGQPRGE